MNPPEVIPADPRPPAPTCRMNKFRVAARMYLLGARPGEIAAAMGITTTTFANWRRHPQFRQALREAERTIYGHLERKLLGLRCRAILELERALDSDNDRLRRWAIDRALRVELPRSSGSAPTAVQDTAETETAVIVLQKQKRDQLRAFLSQLREGEHG